MKKILVFLAMIISIGLFIQETSALSIACTQEAKLCPDGKTWVSRVGPSCEFTKCPDDDTAVCTMEYVPVCGQPPMPRCSAGLSCIQVMPVPRTYGNMCLLEQEKARFLYKGKCEGEVKKAVIEKIIIRHSIGKYWADSRSSSFIVPSTPSLASTASSSVTSTYLSYRNSKTLTIKPLVYYAGDLLSETTFIGILESLDSGKKWQCVGELIKKSPGVLSGTCSIRNLQPGKYILDLEADLGLDEKMVSKGIEILRDTKICPIYEVISSRDGCYYKYVKDEYGCEKPVLVCSGISEKMKIKLDRVIVKLLKRVDSKFDTDEQKIRYLKDIINKLESIADRKTKYRKLINYIVWKLEDAIENYQDDDIDDIFNILN